MSLLTYEQLQAAVKYNTTHGEESEIPSHHEFVMYVAYFQHAMGLKVDGMCGPRTRTVMEAQIPVSPVTWPPFKGPLTRIPNRKEIYAVYGNPGEKELDKHWEKASIVELHKKWGNQLPGVPEHFYVHCHKIMEPYLREGLTRARVACPDYVIERLGCYVWRTKRGDPTKDLSTHAVGIGVDINHPDNGAHEFVRGKAPTPWSAAWLKLWPNGIPKRFVDAMRSVGFAWGGTWSNKDYDTSDNIYIDPPHFELVDWER